MVNVVSVNSQGKQDKLEKSNRARAPVWKTVIKAVLIIVAIAAAIYIGKTYVIPKVVEIATKIKAAGAVVGSAVATSAVNTVNRVNTLTGIESAVTTGTVGIGGAKGLFHKWDYVLKPIEAIKIVFTSLGSGLIETSTLPLPAQGGGGGHAW